MSWGATLGRSRWGRSVAELVPAGGLTVLAAAVYRVAGLLLDSRLAEPGASNVWFDSDVPYRLEVMLHPGGWYNGGAHPLFPTIGHLLLVSAAALTGGGGALASAQVALASVGGLWVGAMYLLFRRMRLTRIDATLFAAVGAVSAGALFWFTVPETFALAGVGVTVALLAAASVAPSPWSLAVGCAASASCILTNGVVGFLALIAHHPRPRQWSRALIVLFAALGLMTAVWALQEWSLRTPFFLGDRLEEYRPHTFPVTLERTAYAVPALLSHPVVAPRLRNDRASFRNVPPATSGPVGLIATAAWAALLLAGALRLSLRAREGETPQLAAVTLGSLLLMLAMHLTLGREMFLYAMNVLPLLLVVAAASARPERGRRAVRVLVCVLLVAAALNNVRQFVRAADAARAAAVQRVTATP